MKRLKILQTYAGADVFMIGKVYNESEIGEKRAADFIKHGTAVYIENTAATPTQKPAAQALAEAKAKKEAQDKAKAEEKAAQDKAKAEEKAAQDKAKAEKKAADAAAKSAKKDKK